jgi:hypothetical protein
VFKALSDPIRLRLMSMIAAAGFTAADVEVTRHYTREDLQVMADEIDAAELPDGMDLLALVDALEGAFASAFIRAVKP